VVASAKSTAWPIPVYGLTGLDPFTLSHYGLHACCPTLKDRDYSVTSKDSLPGGWLGLPGRASHPLDLATLPGRTDIVHVSEYLWKAANALLGEHHAAREQWVYDRLLLLLESRVAEVIAEFEQIEGPPKAVLEAVRYFGNHRHMMDYKRYLGCGYPISTGLVEGCCGHLVKDRMEGSGMRWSRAGAQHVLDIRAVDKNGDWEDFSGFVKEQGQPRILKHAA